MGQALEFLQSATKKDKDSGFLAWLHQADEDFGKWWAKYADPDMHIANVINRLQVSLGGAKFMTRKQLMEGGGTEYVGITGGIDNDKKRRARARQ